MLIHPRSRSIRMLSRYQYVYVLYPNFNVYQRLYLSFA